VDDEENGSPGRPVYSRLQVPMDPGHCRARKRPIWRPPRRVFSSKCPPVVPAEMTNIPRCWFGLMEDNQLGGSRLDPKISRREFPGDFCTRNLLGRAKPLYRHAIDFCFVSR